MNRYKGRSTKYYVLAILSESDKELTIVEKRSVFGKRNKKGKLVYASKSVATGFNLNEKLKRLERIDGVKIKMSKKDRLRNRK